MPPGLRRIDAGGVEERQLGGVTSERSIGRSVARLEHLHQRRLPTALEQLAEALCADLVAAPARPIGDLLVEDEALQPGDAWCVEEVVRDSNVVGMDHPQRRTGNVTVEFRVNQPRHRCRDVVVTASAVLAVEEPHQLLCGTYQRDRPRVLLESSRHAAPARGEARIAIPIRQHSAALGPGCAHRGDDRTRSSRENSARRQDRIIEVW